MILLLKYVVHVLRSAHAKWTDKCVRFCRNKIIIISKLQVSHCVDLRTIGWLPLATGVHKGETKISAAKQMKRSNHTNPMNFVFGFRTFVRGTCTSCTEATTTVKCVEQIRFYALQRNAHSECEYFNFTNIYTRRRNTRKCFRSCLDPGMQVQAECLKKHLCSSHITWLCIQTASSMPRRVSMQPLLE